VQAAAREFFLVGLTAAAAPAEDCSLTFARREGGGAGKIDRQTYFVRQPRKQGSTDR
jgi:hypothetical protein